MEQQKFDDYLTLSLLERISRGYRSYGILAVLQKRLEEIKQRADTPKNLTNKKIDYLINLIEVEKEKYIVTPEMLKENKQIKFEAEGEVKTKAQVKIQDVDKEFIEKIKEVCERIKATI